MNRLIKSICAIAAGELGRERGGRIATAAQMHYEALRRENAGDSRALRAHTFRRIYPCIATYEALRAEGIDRDKAVWYIREYFQRCSAKAEPHLQRLIRVTGLARRIPGIFLRISLRSFGADAGFAYDFPESHGNEARFNIIRCPYFETCKRCGCPEITRAFCDADDARYGNLHPRLCWGRTRTIGRGGYCCDFLLAYRE